MNKLQFNGYRHLKSPHMMTTHSKPKSAQGMVLVVTTDQRIDRYDLETTSRLTGLHHELILELLRAHWVCAPAAKGNSGEPIFDEPGLCRLRQIAELHYKQRISFRMVRKFVRLLDRLDDAERELRSLREQVVRHDL